MDKELVIIVPTEVAAYEVVKALEVLDSDGSIELYASTVVHRTEDGKMSIKDRRDGEGPWGSLLGMSAGALIGLVGGPAGVVIGAALGGSLGVVADGAYAGLSGDFIHDVTDRLAPGGYAVCASVWEDWTVPIDVAVMPMAGVVIRQATEDVAAAQLRAEQQSLKDEWAHFEDEVKKANGDAKAKLEAQRGALKDKQVAQRAKLRDRAKALQARWDARMKAIEDKAAKSKSDARARHQRHHDKLATFAAQQKESFKDLFA